MILFVIFLFSPAEADLRIGEVQWGDSGVYICKVVISDDLEGQNEASVELLVLGKLPLYFPNMPTVKDVSFEREKKKKSLRVWSHLYCSP